MIRIVLISVLFSCGIFAQNLHRQEISGKVSYVTPQNVYLKFASTEGIKKSDTAFVKRNGKVLPGVLIKYISSMSCAGPILNNMKFKVGDGVFTWAEIKPGEVAAEKKAGSEKDSNLTKLESSTFTKPDKFKAGKRSQDYTAVLPPIHILILLITQTFREFKDGTIYLILMRKR